MPERFRAILISDCQESARITLSYVFSLHPAPLHPRPVVGSDEPHTTGVVCEAVCNRKGNNKSRYCELIMLKNIISQKSTTPREVKASRGGIVRKILSYFGLYYKTHLVPKYFRECLNFYIILILSIIQIQSSIMLSVNSGCGGCRMDTICLWERVRERDNR